MKIKRMVTLLCIAAIVALCLVGCEEHQHSAVKTDAKAATCVADGNSAYWYCEGCQKYFSDEACTTEIALADTAVAKTGVHTYDKGLCTGCNAEEARIVEIAGKVYTVISVEMKIKEGAAQPTTAQQEAMDLYCQMNGSLVQIHTFEADGTFKTSTGGHENPYDASYVQVGNWVKATYFYSRYPELEMEDADIIYTITEQGLTSVWDIDAEMISGYENAYMVIKLVEQTT